MIELTVAVPMFRAKYCAWIALESLCRQTGVNFDWELIVAEEVTNDEVFTRHKLMEYKTRLKKVGCKRIEYIGLSKWMPLSRKLRLMASKSSKHSIGFLTNSADLYAPPKRLQYQYNIFKTEKPHIMFSPRTIVYDIKSERVYLNNGLLKLKHGRKITDGTCRAIRMDMAKALPIENKRKGVDAWVWNMCKNIAEEKGEIFKQHIDNTDNWKYALNVHGINNLTFKVREERFLGKGRPYYITACPVNIKKTIPAEIRKRLQVSKKDLSKHKRKLK